jgi:hypothetical protein
MAIAQLGGVGGVGGGELEAQPRGFDGSTSHRGLEVLDGDLRGEAISVLLEATLRLSHERCELGGQRIGWGLGQRNGLSVRRRAKDIGGVRP